MSLLILNEELNTYTYMPYTCILTFGNSSQIFHEIVYLGSRTMIFQVNEKAKINYENQLSS